MLGLEVGAVVFRAGRIKRHSEHGILHSEAQIIVVIEVITIITAKNNNTSKQAQGLRFRTWGFRIGNFEHYLQQEHFEPGE